MSSSTKSLPNATLTARPRIFFPGRGRGPSPLAIEIFGADEPVRKTTREFTREYLTQDTRQYKRLEKAMSKDDRAMLLTLVLLQQAQAHVRSADSAKEMSQAARLLFPDLRPPASRFTPEAVLEDVKARRASTWVYPTLLSEQIKDARLVMARAKGSRLPVPAIMCPDIRTAAFVYVAYRGVAACLGCRKLFAPDPERPERKYCSDRCGQRLWQRAYRRREKRKSKSKNRKKLEGRP